MMSQRYRFFYWGIRMKSNLTKYIPNYYYNKVVDIVDHESVQHYHHAFEIYYLKDGECNYFIDNHLYNIKAGDLILIPEGTIHKTNYCGTTHTRLLINCSYDYIPQVVIERLATINYLYRNNKIQAELDAVFSKIEAECSNPDVLSSEILKCYTAELFFLIMRNENSYENDRDERNLVEQVLDYVRDNYMNDVKLSIVAKHFSVSAEHLSRLFKKETGFGFSEYLTVVRLQKAEYMLRNEPGRAISEVAYACGFNDGNYFSYKFKAVYGVSPTKIKGKRDDISATKTCVKV